MALQQAYQLYSVHHMMAFNMAPEETMCTCTVESHSTRHPIVVSVCYLHAPESQLLQLLGS